MDPSVDLALHSRPLRVGIIIEEVDVFLREGELAGFGIDLIDTVAQSLNFSYELVLPADGEWGDEHDGQWTGLVGLLQRQEIDMGYMLSPSIQRSNVVQWTVPVAYYYNNIAVRTHNVQPDLWTAFVSPFHWSVYTCMLTSFVLCTLLLLHLTRTGKFGLSGRRQAQSLSDVVQLLYGSMLGRGMSWSWSGNADRTVFAGWCVLGFLLMSGYISKLTSLMVGVAPSPPFTTVREMLARSDYRWGMVRGSKPVQILRDSSNSEEQELYQRMMKFAEDDQNVLSQDHNVQLSKVLSENYAYIGDSPIIEIWAADHCDITMLPVKLTGLDSYTFMMPKDSVITGAVDDVLLRLHDSGSLAFLRSKWFPASTHCHGNQPSQRAFSLATLQGPFYAAAAGLLLAVGVLCTERWTQRRGIHQ